MSRFGADGGLGRRFGELVKLPMVVLAQKNGIVKQTMY